MCLRVRARVRFFSSPPFFISSFIEILNSNDSFEIRWLMISRISARLIKISDRNKFQFLSLSLLIRILILTVNKDFFLSFSFLSFLGIRDYLWPTYFPPRGPCPLPSIHALPEKERGLKVEWASWGFSCLRQKKSQFVRTPWFCIYTELRIYTGYKWIQTKRIHATYPLIRSNIYNIYYS